MDFPRAHRPRLEDSEIHLFDSSAEEAMAQIRDKEYDLPYRNDGRRIFRICINFSSATRHLDEPLIEKVEE